MIPTWQCRATVLRVVDGDTLVADFDLGWGTWLRESKGRPNRVRILGYDAPERSDPRWIEARDAVAAVIPATVWVESVRLDSFGRTVGVVRLDDGTDLRDLLPAEWRE